jgi:hypothetical protein
MFFPNSPQLKIITVIDPTINVLLAVGDFSELIEFQFLSFEG